MQTDEKQHRAILQKIAHKAMLQRGLLPDFSAAALVELDRIQAPAAINGEQVHDLRSLLWASIDNDDSRDLDQLTVAEAMPGGKVKIRAAVYYLLASGQHGRWHRVESDEVWSWIEGGGLRLHLFDAATGRASVALLGAVGEACEPVRVTPAGVWQAAEPVEEYALVSCSVGPGFDFADFRFLDSDPEARAQLAAARPDLLRLD